MKLTALVDNSRLANRTDLTVERGLSLHMETMGRVFSLILAVAKHSVTMHKY